MFGYDGFHSFWNIFAGTSSTSSFLIFIVHFLTSYTLLSSLKCIVQVFESRRSRSPSRRKTVPAEQWVDQEPQPVLVSGAHNSRRAASSSRLRPLAALRLRPPVCPSVDRPGRTTRGKKVGMRIIAVNSKHHQDFVELPLVSQGDSCQKPYYRHFRGTLSVSLLLSPVLRDYPKF